MRSSFILLVCLSLQIVMGQVAEINNQWKTFAIEDEDLGKVTYHVHRNKINDRKPLLIYLHGSTNFPLYIIKPGGGYSSSITLNTNALSNDYHVVLISKPNTPLVDTISIAPSGRRQYPMRPGYKERYSLDWRVSAADRVIEDALGNLKVDTETLIVWGHSEGSQVAPAVAVKNNRVTHVIAMMGNALNHLYDFILMQRLSALMGEQSNTASQAAIDSLYKEFEKIYQDPTATDKEWFGETYLKWSSFTLTAPIEHMLKLDIPILYVAGGEDRHSILNMDYARLEFLRRGKANLTYKVYPDCDHFFLETKTDASGKKQWIDRLGEVNGFALDWIAKH